jgi:hypothetical protein
MSNRELKRAGVLPADTIFVTPLTRRVGRVLEAQDERKEDGVPVVFKGGASDGFEKKTLHPRILVEAVE